MIAKEFIPKNSDGKYSRNEVVTYAEQYAKEKVLQTLEMIDNIIQDIITEKVNKMDEYGGSMKNSFIKKELTVCKKIKKRIETELKPKD